MQSEAISEMFMQELGTVTADMTFRELDKQIRLHRMELCEKYRNGRLGTRLVLELSTN